MLEFLCPNCGQRVQGGPSMVRKHPQCPVCSTAMTLPSETPNAGPAASAIAAKIIRPETPSDWGFREGEPPFESLYVRPNGKEIPGIFMRTAPYLVFASVVIFVVALLIPLGSPQMLWKLDFI